MFAATYCQLIKYSSFIFKITTPLGNMWGSSLQLCTLRWFLWARYPIKHWFLKFYSQSIKLLANVTRRWPQWRYRTFIQMSRIYSVQTISISLHSINLPERSLKCMHLYFDINVSGPMICNPLIFPNQKLGQIFL